MTTNIEFEIKRLISESTNNLIDTKMINAETKLFELGLNSISYVRMVVGLESFFDITIDEELLDFDNTLTFGDFVGFIEKMVANK